MTVDPRMLRSLVGGRHGPAASHKDVTDQEGDGGLADALELLRNGAKIANEEGETEDGARDPFTDLGDLGTAARHLAKGAIAVPAPVVDDKPAKDAAAFILAAHRQAQGRMA